MNKLLEGSSSSDMASGQIFYLTDGNPTNLFFFLDPLYSKIKPEAKNCPKAPHIPAKLTTMMSLVFNGLSKTFGKKLRLPFWGFTYMESYKVIILKTFSSTLLGARYISLLEQSNKKQQHLPYPKCEDISCTYCTNGAFQIH